MVSDRVLDRARRSTTTAQCSKMAQAIFAAIQRLAPLETVSGMSAAHRALALGRRGGGFHQHAAAAPFSSSHIQLLPATQQQGFALLLRESKSAGESLLSQRYAKGLNPIGAASACITRGFAADAAAAAAAPESQEPQRKGPKGTNVQHVQRTLKVTDLASPELLAEPYTGPRPSLPFLTSWFTPAGWRARYHNVLREIKNLYALARCTKDISGFSMKTFKTEVLDLYRNVNSLFAAGELTLLKRQATGKCFGLMKKEIKVRQSGGKWSKVQWGLAEEPRLSDVELLQARLLALDPNNAKTHFAQLTVRIKTKHTFAAYDRKGRLVKGDPEASVGVEDTWVVERALVNPDGRWVLAARLTI